MRPAALDLATAGDLLPLLREAAGWRCLSLLLERPRESWRRDLAALIPEIGDPGLATTAAAALGQAAEGSYLALLGPGGVVSPREAGHAPLAIPGILLGDVASFYDAFAFRPVSEEALDHVSVEAGFLGYLRLKQAFALANGDAERAGTVRAAADVFATGHLAQAAEPIARALAAADAPPYLVAASRALADLVGPPPLPTRRSDAAADDGDDFTCELAGA